MKMFIPAIGTRVRLIQPWEFVFYCEERNHKFYDALKAAKLISKECAAAASKITGDKEYWWCAEPAFRLVLPKGTELSVARVYIRQGGAAFESVTFRATIPASGSHKKISGRFWAKLTCVNGMDMEVLQFRTSEAEKKAHDSRADDITASNAIQDKTPELPASQIDTLEF
jgi:hypothetical protein